MRTRLTNSRSSKLNVGNSRTGLSIAKRSRMYGVPNSITVISVDFRLLEDGDFRLLEDGSFRLLE